MRNLREIKLQQTPARRLASAHPANAESLASELETNGVVVLPSLLSAEQLRGMQSAFAARLKRLRWNQFDGYQRTEPYRLMIEDVLLLDQDGFRG